ncbi:DUF896 domain-containing protein [Alkalicoccus halolimnae]|uniref:UPF0291 protein FTX54_009035 n=1 Tax=Alkalicoccus halolimnae TaxID=1667239 RepID=A0A5C7FMT9_9BACI|nr:DUF896 domain-containing protein [Alkalicoccus halolimnae]TXF87299.1 DUF896 domain-containing protein [Alkalicoccus halolimnae]
MISKDKLNRINALAKKSKAEGLTIKEQQEQKELRAEYLKNVRRSFKNQLNSVKVVDKEGEDVTPEKLKREQRKNLYH